MVPTVALPPVTPFTLQVTEEFEVPNTVLENGIVCPVVTHDDTGEIKTLTPEAGPRVTTVLALLVGSATLVAVTFTWGGFGMMEGPV